MTVQTYIPGDLSITITANAAAQARREIARETAAGLRLSVKPSGCSGYMYVLDYADAANKDDKQLTLDGDISLFVDRSSTSILDGTEIDYVTEGVNSFFKFRNPNATGECGCGESFTVKP